MAPPHFGQGTSASPISFVDQFRLIAILFILSVSRSSRCSTSPISADASGGRMAPRAAPPNGSYYLRVVRARHHEGIKSQARKMLADGDSTTRQVHTFVGQTVLAGQVAHLCAGSGCCNVGHGITVCITHWDFARHSHYAPALLIRKDMPRRTS